MERAPADPAPPDAQPDAAPAPAPAPAARAPGAPGAAASYDAGPPGGDKDAQHAGAAAYCARVWQGCAAFEKFVAAPNAEYHARYGSTPRGGVALYQAAKGMGVDFMDGVTDYAGTSVYAVTGGFEAYSDEKAGECARGGGVEFHLPHADPSYQGYVGAAAGPRLECMEGAAPAAAAGPAAAPGPGRAPRPGSLRDGAGCAWTAHLDSPESFVGLYTMAIRPPLAPAEETYCVVVGNVGAGRATEQMYDLAERLAAEGRGFAELTATPEHLYAVRLAQRNRNRLAATFASLLGLRLASMGDLFSAEKLAADAARAAAPARARPGAAARPCRFSLAEWADVAAEARARSDNADPAAVSLAAADVLLARGVDAPDDLLQFATYACLDPGGAVEDNPFVQRDDAAPEAAGRDGAAPAPAVPQVASPFSDTRSSRVVISGRSALVYRDCVPQYDIGEGQGVALVMSASEGVALVHGNDRRASSASPFGNADPDAGAFNVTPTSTGTRSHVSAVPWAAHGAAASVQAPGFLRWQSVRAPRAKKAHPEGRVDTLVPHRLALTGDRCLAGAVDKRFAEHQRHMSTPSLRAHGSTRLDPLVVVLAPQPLADFPGRALPSY
jgi:hypothetical protein